MGAEATPDKATADPTAEKVPADASPETLTPEKVEAPKWQGWKRAVDDELKGAGGELPWKRLRDSTVAKFKTCGEPTMGKSDDDLGCEALASIPEDYLSS